MPNGARGAAAAAPQAPNEPPWWAMSAADVADALATDLRRGLGAEEAAHRLAKNGPNELTERKARPLWRMAVDQVANTMIMVLIAAAVITSVVGDTRDTVVIILVVLLNGAIGFFQERRAEQAMTALLRLAGASARVMRDGQSQLVVARNIVPGDLLQLEPGDVVAADARLVEAPGLEVNEATLTGESQPAEKADHLTLEEDTPLAERRSMVFKGSAVTKGRATAVVTQTGMSTELGRIAGLLAAHAPPTPLQRRLAQLGWQIAAAAVALCAVVFIIGVVGGQPLTRMLLTAVSLAVAAIPESLPAVVTISLALGAQRMARHHAVIRKLLAVETLGCVTVIGTDKTGTLTQGKMQVERVWTADGTEYVVSGDGYDPAGEIRRPSELPAASEALLRSLVRGAALCNDSNLVPPGLTDSAWSAAGDPTEAALLALAGKAGQSREQASTEFPRLREVAFDARRKRMITIHRMADSGGILVLAKGAVETILPMLAAASVDANAVQQQAHRYGVGGYRVLALAGGECDADPQAGAEEALPLRLYGLVAIADAPRPGAAAAVAEALAAGVRTVMITGDHQTTAHAIAERLGILDGGRVMTGADLARGGARGLHAQVDEVAVYARTTAEQKLDIVTAWQAAGHIVAMTGDGVNDAPALRKADIGIAMGGTGTEVSKEAADMVLADDNFATIVDAIREGRRVYDNIRRFVRYGLTGGSAEVWVMLVGPLVGMPLPLLPVQILWVNLLTHGLPGLALGVEAVEPDAMRRPPRPPRETILGRGLWQHVTVLGVVTAVAALGLGLWERSHGGPWQTMLFTALAFLQLGNALAVRSERVSTFALGLTSNRFLIWAVLGTLAIQMVVMYWGPAQRALSTEPLGVADLVTVLAVSTATFWAIEAEKLVRRWKRRTTQISGHV